MVKSAHRHTHTHRCTNFSNAVRSVEQGGAPCVLGRIGDDMIVKSLVAPLNECFSAKHSANTICMYNTMVQLPKHTRSFLFIVSLVLGASSVLVAEWSKGGESSSFPPSLMLDKQHLKHLLLDLGSCHLGRKYL